MPRGRFITFEGGDGAGKTTQARLLSHALQTSGLVVCSTREPGGTPGAEKLRALLLDPAASWTSEAETLLHFAARADHVAQVIRPALERGEWVICDRFTDSTIAYQGGGEGADHTRIDVLRRMLNLEPDLTIILEVSEIIGLLRRSMGDRPVDRYEAQPPEYQRRVAQTFRDIAATEPERCYLIPATGTIQDVADKVRQVVGNRLGWPG